VESKTRQNRFRKYMQEWLAIPENRMRHCLGQARRRSRIAGIEFDICIDDLLPLPAVCPILGITINYGGTKARGFVNDSPSIDKIKPNLGYVKGNVRVICWRANRLKSDATLDELLSIVDYVKRESATCN